MNTQPEALRLADYLELAFDHTEGLKQAAAELRRLHALNQELLEELIKAVALINDLGGGLKYRSTAIAKAEAA